MILRGDCLERLAELPADSVDAVITDPPYGLGFMGHAWDQPGEHAATRRGPGQQPGHPRERARRAEDATPTSMEAGKYDLGASSMRRYQGWTEVWARELLRVAKPGAHLLAFGGTRTVHRLAAGIEDAGWEIRDQLVWGYAQGFPKSLDVAGAIDKLDATTERLERARRSQAWLAGYLTAQRVNELTGTVMGHHLTTHPTQPSVPTPEMLDQLRPELPEVPGWLEDLVRDRAVESAAFASREVLGVRDGSTAPGFSGAIHRNGVPNTWNATTPATPEAREWDGWGTALKPAWEPIVLARKPFQGPVAANVLRHGTGGLDIDGTRIPMSAGDAAAITDALDGFRETRSLVGGNGATYHGGKTMDRAEAYDTSKGRWPANVILTDPIFDGDTPGVEGGGETGGAAFPGAGYAITRTTYGAMEATVGEQSVTDSGGFSRFFQVPAETEDLTCYRCGRASRAARTTDRRSGRGASAHTPALTGASLGSAIATDSATTSGTGPPSSPSESGPMSASEPSPGSPPSEPSPNLDPASPADRPGTSSGTTTTTAGRWMCAGCVADAMRSSTAEPESDGSPETRWFLVPKANRTDREPPAWAAQEVGLEAGEGGRFNDHPTVKPTELMRHLVRLVTPPAGTVLDPFLGSGTTGVAAIAEDRGWIGIERDDRSATISAARTLAAQRQPRQDALDLGLGPEPLSTRRPASKGHWPAQRAPHARDGWGFTSGQLGLVERTAEDA